MAVDWGKAFQAAIPAAAQIAGAYAGSRAQGRQAEATTNQRQDITAQNAYTTDKSLDLNALVQQYEAELARSRGMLDEYEAELAAPGKRAGNAVRGDILANVQDVSVSHPRANVVQASGGLRPSLLSGNSRQLGQQMSREALMDAMQGGAPKPFSGMKGADFSSVADRKAPSLTELPQGNAMDSIMSNIALGGSLYGAIQPAIQGQQQPTVAGQLAARSLPTNVGTTAQAPQPQRPGAPPVPMNQYGGWNI